MENIKFYEKLDEIDKYFLDVKKYKPLSKKEEFDLADKIQQGDEEALQKLVNANLRFVVTIAKQYRNTGVCFSDLISEGNIGLMRAASKFDRNRGVKFISYAVWWIRSSINEYINSLNKYSAVSCDDVTLNNHVKTEYEYSANLINEEFENEMSDMQSRNASIDDLLQSLETRERKILTLYFGLYGNKESTLEEIGQEMQLTKERVRQIKDKAMVKLKCAALMSDEFEVYKNIR